MLQSPEANLFVGTMEMLKATNLLRYIEQDMGQLENYETRPAVSWPCGLIDIQEAKYTDTVGKRHQIAQVVISIRIGLVKYTDSNNLTPTNLLPNALKYYEVEHGVYKALQGNAIEGFGKFSRISSATEKREDDIRVKEIRFAVSYTDTSAQPATTSVPRPNGNITI